MRRSSVSSLVSLSLALALAGGALAGCRLMRATGKAAGSLFDTPRHVDKLPDPIDHEARLTVLWVGHATALIQIDDKVILTDPVFTSTVGQVSKRLVEPGVDPDKLPPIDVVLISHLHFDHLSLGSLEMIEPKVRTMLMPPGGVTYLTDFAFPVVELRPWQGWDSGGLRVTATPVDHVGFRYGIDDAWMKESFTGYVIEYHGMKVYFAGDTAYDQKQFVQTGQRFPAIDVALMPIGPIEPHALMRRFHMSPREALQGFFDLGARHMVPIHYGTFINSTDNPGDALAMLTDEEKKWILGSRDVTPLAIGERHVFFKKGEGPSLSSDKSSDDDEDDSWSSPVEKTEPATKSDGDAKPDAGAKPDGAKPDAGTKHDGAKPESSPKSDGAKPKPKPESDIPDDEKLD